MTKQTYSLTFDGYWREQTINGVPDESGIYCIYACAHNANEKLVNIKRLIYIGESENVRNRIRNHEKLPMWKSYLQPTEVLCFNYASIAPEEARERTEAAMIHHHKPPANTEFVQTFPYDETVVSTSGNNALLSRIFTVYRKSGGLADYIR